MRLFGFERLLMNTAMGGEGGAGGGTPDPSGGTVDPNAGGGGNPDLPDFLKGVDAEFLADPIMKNHKDINSVVKSLVHAQRMVGADKVVVPGKNSSPEEVRAYIAKLGLPETFDKYETKIKDDSLFSGEKAKALKELAHKNNMLPSQLQSVLDFVEGSLDELVTKDDNDSKQNVMKGINELKEKWGEEGFKKNAHLSHVTAKHFGGDEFVKYLNESGLGNDPELIKVFAQIGSKLKQEDVFKRDITQQYGMTKEEAKAAVNNLFSDPAYLDKTHASHNDRLQDMLKYQGIIHGN